MEFEAEAAVTEVRLNSRTYYFCAERCKRLFVEHPERYVPVEPGRTHLPTEPRRKTATVLDTAPGHEASRTPGSG